MKVTEKQANRVIELIKEAFPAHSMTFPVGENGKPDYDGELVPETNPDMLPVLEQDWEGFTYAIVWESGSPYGWVHNFPHGGTDEEFGFTVADVSAQMPKGVYVEPINSCVVGLAKEA